MENNISYFLSVTLQSGQNLHEPDLSFTSLVDTPRAFQPTFSVLLSKTMTFLSFPPVTTRDESEETSKDRMPGTLALCKPWGGGLVGNLVTRGGHVYYIHSQDVKTVAEMC